jgi:hypothetical protein
MRGINGKCKKRIGVIEMDERSAAKICQPQA